MSCPRVHFVSLGCPKNTVDTERMAALASRQGLELSADPGSCDVIVVNTCGFIEAAKQESIDTVLEMAEHKHSGACRELIVAGCLSQRYPDELARELPEVDHFLGTADLGRLARILDKRAPGEARLAVGPPEGLEEAHYRRQLLGPPHSAYLKISEGCNRPCAFCSIPLMRGRQRSRTIESLVSEARTLAAQGVKELILVAQDSTAYGRDLPRGGADLPQLLQALAEIEDLVWIRVHYAYPSMVDRRLVETMASLPRVAPYLDLPIQHVDDRVLRRMRRGYTGDRVRQVLGSLRELIPEIHIRTTLLVGHPGEDEQAHQSLCDFVAAQQVDHLGVFAFSAEDGTAAADQPDSVPHELACQRREELMARQRDVSRARLERLRGQIIDVLVDGVSEESEFLLQGRHAGQSPAIDGIVVLADAEAQAGQLVRAEVTDSGEYDLVARAVGD